MVNESTRTEVSANRAQVIEEQRDLKRQIGDLDELAVAEKRGILFKVTTPPTVFHTLYRMDSGQSLQCPEFALELTLNKRDRLTGDLLFTAKKSLAPEWKPGTISCFLGVDSPLKDDLDEIGLLANCPKSNLTSVHAARRHGMSRHTQEWAAWQEHLDTKKEAKAEARQEKQLDATLDLARQAAGQITPTDTVTNCTFEDCTYTGSPAQVRGHQSSHKE